MWLETLNKLPHLTPQYCFILCFSLLISKYKYSVSDLSCALSHAHPRLMKSLTNSFNPFIHSIIIYWSSMNVLLFICLFTDLEEKRKENPVFIHFPCTEGCWCRREYGRAGGGGIGDRHTQRSVTVLFTEHSTRGVSSANWELRMKQVIQLEGPGRCPQTGNVWALIWAKTSGKDTPGWTVTDKKSWKNMATVSFLELEA